MPHQCTSCGRTFADGSKEMLSGCPDCGGNKFQFMPAEAVEGDAGSSGGHGAVSQNRNAGGTAPKKRPDDASSTADAPPVGDAPSTADASSAGDAPETGGDRGAVNRAAATVREWVGSGGSADDRAQDHESAQNRDPARKSDEPAGRATGEVAATSDAAEDSAQASARRDVVTEDELPEDPPETTASVGDTGGDGRTAGASPADDAPASASTVDDSTSATSAESASTDSASGDGESASVGAGSSPREANDEAAVVDAPDDRNPGLEELREELNSQFESIRIEEPGQYELNLMELYEREEYIISLQEDGKYVIEVPDAWDAVDR